MWLIRSNNLRCFARLEVSDDEDTPRFRDLTSRLRETFRHDKDLLWDAFGIAPEVEVRLSSAGDSHYCANALLLGIYKQFPSRRYTRTPLSRLTAPNDKGHVQGPPCDVDPRLYYGKSYQE
jgi:hypothetical protein